MRKILDTIRLELEILGIPKTAKELDTELALLQFQIQKRINSLGLVYEALPYFLGKSKLRIDCEVICSLSDKIAYLLLGETFINWKRERVLDFLRKLLLESQKYELIDSPYSIPIPNWKEKIQRIVTEPRQIYLLDLHEVKGKLKTETPKEWNDGWVLQFESGMELQFRIGYLESIDYLFTKQRFKRPYPKLAECYVRERDRWSESQFGDTLWRFRGYLLENETDEFLLEYWNLNPQLPKEIRKAIPEEVWLSAPKSTGSSKKYRIELKERNDLSIRTVYLVSTSLQDHPEL